MNRRAPNILAMTLKDSAMAGQGFKNPGSIIITPDVMDAPQCLDILMVVDISASMKGDGITAVEEALAHLANLMRPDDRMAIITFNRSAMVHMGWSDKNAEIPTFDVGLGTNFGAAINKTLSFLTENPIRSDAAGMMLLLSDGKASIASRKNVATLPTLGMNLHCLGITDDVNPKLMEQMAESANGTYLHAREINQIEAKFRSFVNLGQTVVYAVPTLKIHVREGVIVRDLCEAPFGHLLIDEMITGTHEVRTSHLLTDKATELSFKLEVENINIGPNSVLLIEFNGAKEELFIEGESESARVINSNINHRVTMVHHTVSAAQALKYGDEDELAKTVSRLEAMNTIPGADDRATTIILASEAASETGIADGLEHLGKIVTTRDGKTKLRE